MGVGKKMQLCDGRAQSSVSTLESAQQAVIRGRAASKLNPRQGFSLDRWGSQMPAASSATRESGRASSRLRFGASEYMPPTIRHPGAAVAGSCSAQAMLLAPAGYCSSPAGCLSSGLCPRWTAVPAGCCSAPGWVLLCPGWVLPCTGWIPQLTSAAARAPGSQRCRRQHAWR